MNGLDLTALLKPGLLSRLTKRKVAENAYLEVQNLLATTPIREIRHEAVSGKLREYGLSLDRARPRFKELYGKVLHFCARDHVLSDEEVEDLKCLRILLGLNQADTDAVQRAVLGGVYSQALREAISDERLSQEEKARLAGIVEKLRIPDDVVKSVLREDGTALLKRVLEKSTSDRRLSPEEDRQFQELAEGLGITVEHDQVTGTLLDRFKLFWRIEQGNLPEVEADIHLQRGERCHISAPASHHEFRTVTKAIRYGGMTTSIKIIGSLRYRAGHVNVQRVTREVLTPLGTGVLYITSKRLLFNGDKKNVSIAHGKIIDFEQCSNGFKIEKDSGKPQFFECSGDLELYGIILDTVLGREPQVGAQEALPVEVDEVGALREGGRHQQSRPHLIE